MWVKSIKNIKPVIDTPRLSLTEIVHHDKDKINAPISIARSKIADYMNPRKSESEEICIILEGEGKLYVLGLDARDVKKDDVIYIEPGEMYHLENHNPKQPLECMHITYPAWQEKLEKEIKL
ncbi:MAG: cupin domain-containing protein [Candidatus Nanoarchaeia archaeon]|nr:cupin domain-containing protein [Candidatus Nanoarchaeia archaeon]MDD5239177.1 cupin domain-containing protein [Candidatus Nanoarchaeia archaeon]